MLSLPQGEVQPLQMLTKTGENVAERLNADISDVFTENGFALPVIKETELPSSVSIEENINLKLNTGLQFFKNLINYFNIEAKTTLAYEQADIVKIKLGNPKLQKINILHLKGFVDSAMLTDSPSVIEMLARNDLYIITEVVKVKDFTIETGDDSAVAATVDIGNDNLLKVEAGIKRNKSGANHISHQGINYLTFAVKAYRVFYDKNWWSKKVRINLENADQLLKVKSDAEFQGELLSAEVYINL